MSSSTKAHFLAVRDALDLVDVEAGYVWRVLMFVEIEEKTKGTNLIAFDLAGSYNEPAPATCTEQTCGCG